MTPCPPFVVRAAVSINGANGALLGGRGALSAASAIGFFLVLLEERIDVTKIIVVASARGGASRFLCSSSVLVQNIVELTIVDQNGNLANPIAFDVIVLESV